MTEKKRTLHDIYETDNKEKMQRKKSCFYSSTINTISTTRSVAAMVVIGMVLMGIGDATAASSSRTDETNLTRLWERVTSHTETLRNINYYLQQTDIFWSWFQKNKGRLDEVLSTSESSSPSDNVRLLERLDDLERKQNARDEEMQQMRSALQQERERTTRMEARLRQHEATEDSLRRQLESILSGARMEGDGGVGGGGVGGGGDEMNNQTYKLMTYVRNLGQVVRDDLHDLRDDKIPELEERISQLETKLVEVNRTALANKRAIDGRVTTDLHDLRQQTDNLMEVVDQEVIDLKRQIGSLSGRKPPKQHGSNRGLQNQITRMQTSLAKVQGDIARMEGRLSNVDTQQTQLEEARKDRSRLEASIRRLQAQLTSLQQNSGNMNLDFKTRITKLENDVADLQRYNNLTEHVRRISIPNATPTSVHPIGPPGYGFEGGFGRPGNQGLSGEPGDPGLQGPPGTPGAPGVPGTRGGQGSPGAPGARGPSGARGAPGDPGEPGYPGSSGARGASGSAGLRGALGMPGSPGRRGAAGQPGYPGSSGARGYSGSAALRGAPGMPGSPGRRGAAGQPGYPGGYADHSNYSAAPSNGRYSTSTRYGSYYRS